MTIADSGYPFYSLSLSSVQNFLIIWLSSLLAFTVYDEGYLAFKPFDFDRV
jgi:hypothetical protein